MKNLLRISLLFLPALLAGCDVEESAADAVQSNDEINDMIFYKAVTPFCRVVELSDFYNRYRTISDNETAVEALKTAYFGDTVSMGEYGEEGVEVEYWGAIDTDGQEGEYLATVSPHWMGLEPSYTVDVTGGRSYGLSYNSSVNDGMSAAQGYVVTMDADVSAGDGSVTVEALDIVYTETSSSMPLTVKVHSGSDAERVEFSLCSGGEFDIYPFAGVLYYSVSGYFTGNFKVMFYGDYFEIVDGDMPEADID